MKASGTLLRPLNIGEIFDRAITLYVKHFVTLALIVLTLMAPYAIATYFFAPDQSSQIQQIVDAVQHPQTAQKHQSDDPFPGYTAEKAIGFGLSILVFLLLAPFANNAVALAVASLYQGGEPDYQRSYRGSFRRWLPTIGTGILVGLIFFGGYLLFIFLFVLLLVAGGALVQSALPLAIILFIIAGLAFLAFLIAIVVLFMVATFSLYSVAIENYNPAQAIGAAFNRLLSRGEFWKAFLIALSAVAFQIGISSIAGMLGLACMFLLHSSVPNIVITALTNTVVTGFITVLLAVYYYDVRVRREGLDLEVQMTQLTGA